MIKSSSLAILIALTTTHHGFAKSLKVETTQSKLDRVSESKFGKITLQIAPVAAKSSQINQYSVRTEDVHLRNTLARWAQIAGWQFGPPQWAIPYDISVVANADLGDDFKSSVRTLLGTTELTDLPLQPCFYSNQVLRVVPASQKCDRNVD